MAPLTPEEREAFNARVAQLEGKLGRRPTSAEVAVACGITKRSAGQRMNFYRPGEAGHTGPLPPRPLLLEGELRTAIGSATKTFADELVSVLRLAAEREMEAAKEQLTAVMKGVVHKAQEFVQRGKCGVCGERQIKMGELACPECTATHRMRPL
jgi:hypothetical protein